jgi:PAS fold
MTAARRNESHDFHPVAVLDAHPDGILVVDQDGVVRYANPAAALAFDAKLATMIGRQFSLPLEGNHCLEIRAAGDRLLRMRCRPTLWAGNAARLVCLTDVTEVRRTEHQLQALAQRLEERDHPVTDIDQLDLVCDELEALARSADALYGRLRASPILLVRQVADLCEEHAELLRPVLEQDPELRRLPALLEDLANELQVENTSETETADQLRRALGRLRARVRQVQRHAAKATPEPAPSWVGPQDDPTRSLGD